MEKVLDRPILDVVLERLKRHLSLSQEMEIYWKEYGGNVPEIAPVYSYSPNPDNDYHPLKAAKSTFHELIELIGPDEADEYLEKFSNEVGLNLSIVTDFVYSYRDVDYRARKLVLKIKKLAESLRGSYHMKEWMPTNNKIIIGIDVSEGELKKLVLELIDLIGIDDVEKSVGGTLSGLMDIDSLYEEI